MLMMAKMHALSVTDGGEAPFPVNAVDFDGSSAYMLRGAGLTGAADSYTGILSVWLRRDGGDGSAQQIFVDDSLTTGLKKLSSNAFQITLADAGITTTYSFNSSAYTVSATWLHVLASWDTNFSSGNKVEHLYISDVSDVASVLDSNAAFDIDYTRSNWQVGARTNGSEKYNGCMAELYFAPGQFLDFSVVANRRKFISAAGKPVNLGIDGSLPTGSQPIVYLNNPAASFGTNKGSGGDFSIVNSLSAASTSPSD